MNLLVSNYFVDAWSLIHVLFMFCLFSYFIRDWGVPSLRELLGTVIILAYGWEFIEVGIVWILDVQHDEPAANRWLFDPLFGAIGAVLAYAYEELMRSREDACIAQRKSVCSDDAKGRGFKSHCGHKGIK